MQSNVEVFAKGGFWIVRICDGVTTDLVRFEREESAQSYAKGQRMRLGLPSDEVADIYASASAPRAGEQQ